MQVAVVSDDALVRAGLREILRQEPGVEVPFTSNSQGAVGAVQCRRPDVVLLDLQLSTDGQGLLKALRALNRPPAVAALTATADRHAVNAAFAAGAAACLVKDITPYELVHAVCLIGSGGFILSSTAVAVMKDEHPRPVDPALAARLLAASHLTDREREVLALLAAGLSNAEISSTLTLSTNTVKDHIKATYAKLGVHNRVQAAVMASMAGLAAAA
ncbi:response regulator transcription factor [Streptomyces coacervatus]|uniref:Response regulator transcription factor n=1 Tax=Streptomyces coacervatus TaxID=647381 RepID=A0ABP7HNT0_9ACTN|nr:response regulator transcription factor [Streptomyces coacervatus]MDF2270723.1 response regulator transcription factor [Streptomyces coacervatus]